MSLKAKLEALIYAAEEPIGIDHLAALLKDDLLALKNAPQPETETATISEPQEAAPVPDETPAPDLGANDAPAAESAASGDDHLGATEPEATVAVEAPAAIAPKKAAKEKSEKVELRGLLKPVLEQLIADYESEDRGIEIRQVAGGYRMSTKPEHHDVVRAFAKGLKPPIRLSLQALETLAVIAYKQPVTVPEISDIRGVDSAGVIGTLLERKLIGTAGRKAVVGRPMLYKTTKDFLMRFGLNEIAELPSIEEFEKMAAGDDQGDLFGGRDMPVADATGVPDSDGGVEQMAEDKAEVPQNVTEPTVSSDPDHDKSDDEAANQIASESSGG
jgi:segregation and condensation protein B